MKEKPPVKTVLEVRHAEAKLEFEHRLHIRAPAGVPAPDLALRAHHRGRADGLRQDDGGELVSFRARQARRSRRCAYQRVFGQSGHLLEERAGGLFPRGVRLSARLPLPRRRRGRKPPDGRSLPRARGQAALLYFHRRLSPLDRQPRARLSLHADEPPARKRSPDRRKPRPLPARGGDPAPWRQALHRGHRAAAPQPHGALDLRPPLRHGALGRADRIAALFERGVVLGHLLKSPHAARARRAAEPQLGYLRDVLRRDDRPAAVKAARIFGRHGSCGRIHRRDGRNRHRQQKHRCDLTDVDRAERLCQAPAGRRDVPLPPHDEGLRRAHVPHDGAAAAGSLP